MIGLNAFSNTNIKSAIFSNRLKSVSNNAFKNCANLESVDFVSCAADFSNIPSYAFADCTKLNLIKLSNYIKTIDTFAFNNCSSLLNLDFSEKNIVNIESEAFANCSNLKSLSLPESVSNVGTNAFNGIDNLETITLGNLFYDNNQTMLGVFGTSLSQIKNIILVGSKIESLNADYFSSCVALESFTMNNSIISVEQNAFANCTNLINITFSDAIQGEYFDSSAFFDTAWYKTKDQIIIKNNSVLIVPLGCPAELEASNFENATTIAINAFVQNNTVTKVTLPATLKFIGDRAFYKCTNLEEVIFENGSMLSSIGVEAFFDCRSLSKINLQVCTNLKLIGNRAFSKIGQVEIFNIPASIESFRIACFENSKIKTFNINGENSKYYTENGVIYEKLKSGKAIYAYPIGKQESAFLIDSNVKKIYESAFFGATLDYIYIASSTLIFAGDAYSRAFDNTLTKILIASSNVVLPINTYNWNVYYLLSDNYTYIEETNSIELTSSTLNKNGYYVSVEIDSIQHYYLLQLNSGNLTWQVEITSDVKDLIN